VAANLIGTSDPYLTHFASDQYLLDMSTLPFTDFLLDVMDLKPYEASRMEENQGLSIFDFGDDAALEPNDMDFGLLDLYNNGDFMNNDQAGVPD
jgi:hypothetical protein